MAALGLTQLKQRDGRIETLIRLFSEGHSFIMEKDSDGTTTSKTFKISGIVLRVGNRDTEILKKDVNTKQKRAAAVKKLSRFTGKLFYNGFMVMRKQNMKSWHLICPSQQSLVVPLVSRDNLVRFRLLL